MARVWRFHAFTLPCMGKPSETATTCEGDYKQLGPAVYHSTGFLQRHNSHKRFLKKSRGSQCPFPGNMSIELAAFKVTRSHKRVLSMPPEVAVVSIS